MHIYIMYTWRIAYVSVCVCVPRDREIPITRAVSAGKKWCDDN